MTALSRQRRSSSPSLPGLALGLALAALAGWGLFVHGRTLWDPALLNVTGRRTVAQAVEAVEEEAEERLRAAFLDRGLAYPPEEAAWLCFKAERRLEVWAPRDGRWRFVRAYPILAASGGPGPKLRKGDGQVPEGVYRIQELLPNSGCPLALKLDYPNAYDLARAREEGRTALGGDIRIQGQDLAAGCLALGDAASAELFLLAARVGVSRVSVLLAPCDLRRQPAPAAGAALRPWVRELYGALRTRLEAFVPDAPVAVSLRPDA